MEVSMTLSAPHNFASIGGALLAAIGIAGCMSAALEPTVGAPKLAVGDRWQYRVTDNLRRGVTGKLDAEVIAIAAGVATVRMSYADPTGRSEWVNEVEADGDLRAGVLWRERARQFTPPVTLFAFPLEHEKTWRQIVDTMRPDSGLKDQILIYGRVDDRQPTTVLAGAFDTIYIHRIVQLDDEEFWRTRTTRRDSIWYAPDAKAPAREVRDAEYTEKSTGRKSTVRTESTVTDLLSFTPGAM
jgi:hypothetical protein